MGAAFSEMLLVAILTLVGSGGNHLLDYAFTDTYWHNKGVPMTVEAMAGQLKVAKSDDISKLIPDLASPDPKVRELAEKKILQIGEGALPQLQEAKTNPDPQLAVAAKKLISDINTASKVTAVRRLMAVRTLGELKKPEALPILKPLLDSKEMFVAEYAARAIASIEGKPYTNPRLTDQQRMTEVWMMPNDTRAVMQQILGQGPILPLDKMLDKLPAALPPGLAGPNAPPMDKNKLKEEITKAVIQVAENVGDVRVDAITLGLSAEVGRDAGTFVAMVRGEYDAKAAASAMRKLNLTGKMIAGAEAFQPDEHVAIIFPGNQRAMFVTGAHADKLPIESTLNALRAGKGPLADVKDMADLLAKVDTASPMWAAALVTDSYKQAPVLNAFDIVTMTAKPKDGRLNIQIDGKGSNPDAVKGAVNFLNTGVAAGIGMMNQMKKEMPLAEPIADFLNSIQCTAKDTVATFSASLKEDIGGTLLPAMMMLGVAGGSYRAQPLDAVPPEVEQKAVPEKAVPEKVDGEKIEKK